MARYRVLGLLAWLTRLQVLRPVLATHPTWALANASVFLEACGHTVLAWIWLDVALAVLAKDKDLAIAAHRGSMAAQRYFFHYELPRIGAWLQVVKARDMTCAGMEEEAF